MLGLSAIRSIIRDRCELGYVLTDDECGIALIRDCDVEDSGGGLFTARFRLPVEKEYAVGTLARLVCGDVGSGFHLFARRRVEWGVPFLDCVWVLAPDELAEGTGEKPNE